MKTAKFLILILIPVLTLASCSSEEDTEVYGEITLSRTEISFDHDAATSLAYLTISSTYAWTAVTDSDWLTISPSSGTAGAETRTTVRATENTLSESRSGTITISSGKSVKTVSVTQSRGALVLTEDEVENYDRIYIPSEYSKDRFLTSEGTWFFGRSAQSEHFILFWEAGYGEYGDVTPSDCENTRYRVDVQEFLDWAEECYDEYVNVLKFAEAGKTQLDNYKFEIFLHYSTEWAAYGWGQDNVVGCLWVNPDAANSKSTVAHEIGHSFQYQTYCDLLYNKVISSDNNRASFRYDRGENGTGFWEQTSQWQAAVMCPEEAFGNWYFSVFCENAHRHFLHEDMRYGSFYLHYYWTDKRGIESIAEIWKVSRSPKDAIEVYRDLYSLTQEELNAELYDYAARVATWDFDDLREEGIDHLNVISWKGEQSDDGSYKVDPSVCPEATGFNIIRIQNYRAGEEITMDFQGLPNEPGYN